MTIKELAAAQAKAMKDAAAKDILPAGTPKLDTKDATDTDKAQVKAFFTALAGGDRSELKAMQDAIAADYEAKGFTISKDQNTGTSGNGGYLVPTILDATIRRKLKYVSPIRQISTVIENMPAKLNLPAENALPTVSWEGEGVAGTDTSATWDLNALTPHKLIGLDTMTHEILADAAVNESVQNYVLDRFVLALALAENLAFTNGDGTDRPFGFRSSAITPASVAQVSTSANGLAYTDVTGLKYALPTAYRKLATFVASSKGLEELENLRDNYGRPIFREGLSEDMPATLLGRPIVEVDEIPENLGTGTDSTEIWFGMFSNYIIGDREALRVDLGTKQGDFEADKVTLRVIKRVAGRPILGESFAKLTGVK